MKELLKRFRFWLIKKLGGETSKIVVNACPEVRTVPVRAQVMVPDYFMLDNMLSEDEKYRFIKRQLSEQLAEYLLRDDALCQITQSTDNATGNVVCRMTIRAQPKGQAVSAVRYEKAIDNFVKDAGGI